MIIYRKIYDISNKIEKNFSISNNIGEIFIIEYRKVPLI